MPVCARSSMPHVRPCAQRLADIMAKRSDVRSAPAADLQHEAAVRVFVQHLDGVTCVGRGSTFVDPLPRQIAELARPA